MKKQDRAIAITAKREVRQALGAQWLDTAQVSRHPAKHGGIIVLPPSVRAALARFGL